MTAAGTKIFSDVVGVLSDSGGGGGTKIEKMVYAQDGYANSEIVFWKF